MFLFLWHGSQHRIFVAGFPCYQYGLSCNRKFFGGLLPIPSPVLAVLNFLLSFIGVAVLFGLIFRFVPEARVRWQSVWPGALVTAIFFTIGKTLIGLYLGKSSVGSPSGAAGSVIVVIVWVYYSAQIFFFGAEFTHAYADHQLSVTGEVPNPTVSRTAA
jgi:membrane protein